MIPAQIGRYPVTEIGHDAFYGKSSLSGTLTIPDGVTYIDIDAFYRCSGFDGKLTIPAGVTIIETEAFAGCTGLEKAAVQVTESDGTVTAAERTAVYCLRGSYAWSWAEEQTGFEPVEWDGVSQPGSPPETE